MTWLLSLLGIGGVAGALAYFVGPAALLTFGKSALTWLSKIPWQAWAALALAVLVSILYIRGNHWEAKAHKAEAQVSADCSAIRKSHPKLACDQTDEQIAFMAQALTDLSNALAKQNAYVSALALASKNAQDEAEKARRAALQRVKGAETTSERLAASARSGERLKQPCAPSKELERSWR